MKRSGFSLIELVVALISATVLVLGLASTVVVTTQLLESPPDDAGELHQRVLVDRLAADLRYASDVTDGVGNGFEIERPDPTTGSGQRVTYESTTDGFTRSVDGGAPAVFDPDQSAHAFQVDGYTAATVSETPAPIRLRGTSKAGSFSRVDDLRVSLPVGCVNGDLLILCVAAKSPQTFWLSESGWQVISVRGVDDLAVLTVYRSYYTGMPDSVSVNVFPDSAISAAMLSFENVDTASPISWSSSRTGYSYWYQSNTHPQPLEPTSFSPGQLNVQVFAGDGQPWDSGTLGIASFTDAAQASTDTGGSWSENSIGIAIRSGLSPNLSTTPRLWQRASGYWIQTGIRLEVKP